MLVDNRANGKVGDLLKEHVTPGSKLSIVSALFSIYGFEAFASELAKVDSVRLLLTSAGIVASDMPDSVSFPALAGDEFERRLQNRLQQKTIARECARWLQDKVDVRLVTTPGRVNQALFHVTADSTQDSAMAMQGSSPFTASGLGYTPSARHDMNFCVTDAPNTNAMLRWFETIWQDPVQIKDVKEALVDQLEAIASDRSPEFVYFLTLYNLFRDFLSDLDEGKIVKSKTGFLQTRVWNKLYRFQRDGVLGAIDKLEKYNGCIIADSVGLGKTFEGLAVIKYYELRNDRVLVLCPKRLRENWTIYTVNDKRNLFVGDRFNFDVLNHTDLSRAAGQSGEINLATINWGNYDLIVIDESHNFRNNNPRKGTVTRYQRLMQDIIKAGVKTKVLMLSATPVNNRMNDLKNQVAFITEGRDEAFETFGIESIEKTMRQAQTCFNQWLRLDDDDRRPEALLEMMTFDYFRLLDLVTIARSRKHIEKYYSMAEIGTFPERLEPRNIKADIDTESQFPPLREINRTIRRLNLAAYAPLKYVRHEKRDEYGRKYDMSVGGGRGVLRQVDREQSLIHLMRVNLLKRMESSIYSFAATVTKLLGGVNKLLGRIDAHDPADVEELSIRDVEIDAEEFEPYLIGNKIKVLIQDMDLVRWKQELQEDKQHLTVLLREASAVDVSRDEKLRVLKALIAAKHEKPINSGNNKILVFTAFADTAEYLYDNIASWAAEELGSLSALVTGSGPNQTTLPGIRKDINSLLTSFSPRSKERAEVDPELIDEIDILIATDCISEGQNLQDCDFVVNYDIHWNPVRIIQRFGRIDRLGSKNDTIQLINFWPNMELDEYINLEARVSGRMVLLDISATGEENIIEYDGKKMNDLEYRRKQLKQLQDAVMDIEEISGGISIADMTLNDFRMDLCGYLKKYGHALKTAPLCTHAVLIPDDLLTPEERVSGILFCLRDVAGKVQADDTYALAPHYLIYVSDDGDVLHNPKQTKKMLDLFRKHGLGRHAPDTQAIADLDRHTGNGKDMSHYRKLLEVAVQEIIGRSEEKGVESLFTRGGTVVATDTFRGVEDFEVISFLIVRGEA